MDTNLRYLALGDSYTIGEGVESEERWPHQLVKMFSENKMHFIESEIIAVTGWTTRNLIEAIKEKQLEKQSYDLISILIGVNNQYQRKSLDEYSKEFDEILDIAIALTKENDMSRIIVLSIPDWGYSNFAKSEKSPHNPQDISRELAIYNSINKQLTEKRGIIWVNITNISETDEDSYYACDNLHPSAKQYREWAKEAYLAIERRF